MREVVLGVVVAVPFVLGLTTSEPGDHVAFRFQDRAITESSGLVIEGDLAYTTNDSGDSGRIFAVDVHTGETVGVTDWADDPTDVEALAPAGPGAVWVADIGDNAAERGAIEVTRLPVGRGDRRVDVETYELTYPGGPVDAETLLADPATGRLYIVTKQVWGGSVLAAPAELSPDGENVLMPVGTATGIATDGAFFPDGQHVLIRSYGDAVVYAWPALTRVASFALPDQEQGEGLAIGADDSLWLSSEGVRAPVLHLPLPADVQQAIGGLAPSPVTPTATPTPATSQDPSRPHDPANREAWPWLLGLLLFAVAATIGVRSVRPR